MKKILTALTLLVGLLATSLFAAPATTPLKVHIISGSEEYKSEPSLQEFSADLQKRGIVVTASWGKDKGKTLPNLDDEFAKDVSEKVETLEQLKVMIKDEISKVAEQKTKNEVRDAAISGLIEQNPFEVPSSLVDRQAEQIAAERLQRLPQQQAEMLWQSQGQRMKEDARPMALRQVRISLLLEEIVKRESIAITEVEIEAHFERMAAELNTPLKTVKSVFAKGNRVEELEFQLLTQKALDAVLAAADYESEAKPLSV